MAQWIKSSKQTPNGSVMGHGFSQRYKKNYSLSWITKKNLNKKKWWLGFQGGDWKPKELMGWDCSEWHKKAHKGMRSHRDGAHLARPNRSCGGTETSGCFETSGQHGGSKEEEEDGGWPGSSSCTTHVQQVNIIWIAICFRSGSSVRTSGGKFKILEQHCPIQ